MPTAEDVAVVRRLYTAVAAGNLTAVAECFDEEAVWHLPGANALSGTHCGWSAIRDDLLAKQGPLSSGTFRAKLLDLAVGTEYIVAVVHATAERSGYRWIRRSVSSCESGRERSSSCAATTPTKRR